MSETNLINGRRYLAPAEFAHWWGISEKRARNLISARQLPVVHMPGLGLRVDIRKFIERAERCTELPAEWRAR